LKGYAGFTLEDKCKGKGKTILHTGLVTSLGFQGAEAPGISRLSAYEGDKVVSLT